MNLTKNASEVAKNRLIGAIYFLHNGIEIPAIKVEDNGNDQVVLIFRNERQMHITLHKEKDGGLLRTIYDEDKPPKTYDNEVVLAAKALGYRNSEKHRYYVTQQVLVKMSNMDGYHLVGKRIDLTKCKRVQKYKKLLLVDSKNSNFFMNLYLSTPENMYQKKNIPSINTSFGDIFFERT